MSFKNSQLKNSNEPMYKLVSRFAKEKIGEANQNKAEPAGRGLEKNKCRLKYFL